MSRRHNRPDENLGRRNRLLEARVHESRRHDSLLANYSRACDLLCLGRVSEVEGREVTPEEFLQHGSIRNSPEHAVVFWKRRPVLRVFHPDLVLGAGQTQVRLEYAKIDPPPVLGDVPDPIEFMGQKVEPVLPVGYDLVKDGMTLEMGRACAEKAADLGFFLADLTAKLREPKKD